MRAALELRPNYLRGFDFLGRLYRETGRSQDAIDIYLEALEVDPTLAWARERIDALLPAGPEQPSGTGIDLALDEIGQGRYEEAVTILESSRRTDPDNPDVLFNLGFAYQRLGRRAQAIESYEALLEISPDHRKGNFNLGYAYLQGPSPEEWESSIDRFEKVLEIDPEYAEAIHRLATAHWKLGRKEEALSLDRQYLEEPGHQELRARSSQRIAEASGP
jgi:tetratricopeptide (TPR) repeat protein